MNLGLRSFVVDVLLSSGLFAQLDQNCTVSILNRSTHVDASGNWRIDNIPSTFGPLVARATCVNITACCNRAKAVQLR
jgi:hypothetical protein